MKLDDLQPLVTLVCCWAGILLSAFAHELGHLLGHRLGGRTDSWVISVGSGPAILKTERLTFRLIPAGGWFWETDETGTDTKKRCLLMLCGGPLVSLLLTAGLFALSFSLQTESFTTSLFRGRTILLFVRNYNLFLFLITAIPWRYPAWFSRIPVSDGLQILRMLKKPPKEDRSDETGTETPPTGE